MTQGAGVPESRFKLLGAAITALVHVLVVGTALGMHALDARHTEQKARRADDKMNHIEAGLARRAEVASGRRSSLPSKDLSPKVRPPSARGVATDPDQVTDGERKDDPYVPPDMQDPNSAYEAMKRKYGSVDTGERAGSGEGSGEDNVAGDPDGSEFGTLDVQTGDPYLGELIGRMTVDFTVPGTVPAGQGLETWGCVRLEADGRVADRKLDPEHKSRSYAFNSAVEDRLRKATDMDRRVPDHLKKVLVEQFACVPFRY